MLYGVLVIFSNYLILTFNIKMPYTAYQLTILPYSTVYFVNKVGLSLFSYSFLGSQHQQPSANIPCCMMIQWWATSTLLLLNVFVALIIKSKHPHDASLLVFPENNINLCQWIIHSWNQISLPLLWWIVFHKVEKKKNKTPRYSQCSVRARHYTVYYLVGWGK